MLDCAPFPFPWKIHIALAIFLIRFLAILQKKIWEKTRTKERILRKEQNVNIKTMS